jgi:hypothetical protein
MTLRGFLAYYLGAVTVVGGVGASAYQELHRRHAAMEAVATPKPVVVAEATHDATPPPAPPVAAAVTPPAPAPVVAAAPPTARALPKLRPHVATAVASNPKPWPRVAVTHAPPRQPPRTAHNEIARNEASVYQAQPYGPPPEMPYGYYASPAYYPYAGYYGGYGYYPPRYGYYRSY